MATILIVDDLAADREFLLTLLRSQGHRVLEAADGREALGRPCRQRGQATSRNSIASTRLLTDTNPKPGEELRTANARLRALIDIGLELSSELDPDRLFQRVGVAARDLFGATYVTLGIVDPNDGTMQRLLTCGADAAAVRTPPTGSRAVRRSPASSGRSSPSGARSAARILAAIRPDCSCRCGIRKSRHTSPRRSRRCRRSTVGCVSSGMRAGPSPADDEPLFEALSAQAGRIYERLSLAAAARKRAGELEHQILDRQRAESTVRYERDRAQRYLDVAQVILLNLDVEGRITLINRKGCELLGWTERELLGRDFLDTCLPARTRVALRTRFHEVLGGDCAVIETAVLTRSGGELLIEWRNTLLRDDAGDVVGTFSSGTDITERNRAVEALRTAEERMRFALENANVGIWDLDYVTGTLRWSETIEIQYGLQPGTFAGTIEAFIERVHPDDRAMVLETFANAAKSGADFCFDHRSMRPDGTVRWLSGAGRVQLGDHGEPLRGVGTSLDVTERRALEEQYLQAQKMEAVGLLAGGVAHDFNNLLTEILGHCELLLADLDPDDTRQADIAEIQKAGARAAGLTRQLMAFSRKEIIEPTVLDLNGVVAGMRGMLGRLIGENVNVVLSLRPELARVKADHGQIEQILMNLAVNARDAMPSGGTLRIETANIELGENDAKTTGAVKPGAVRGADGGRHRHRHDAAGAGAIVRAVLHHQGTRRRHRAGSGDRRRHRQAERRGDRRPQRGRPGHVVHGLFPQNVRQGDGRRRTAAGRPLAGPGPHRAGG